MIYILDNDIMKSASYLDDRSLEKQIKDISGVLCYVHRKMKTEGYSNLPYYSSQKYIKTWTDWAQECQANYLWLVEYGINCTNEYIHRFGLFKSIVFSKHRLTIVWARDNIPDLPDKSMSAHDKCNNFICLPLIIPKKYHYSEIIRDERRLYGFSELDLIISQYKYFYQAKLKQSLIKKHKTQIIVYNEANSIIKWTNRQKPEWADLNEKPCRKHDACIYAGQNKCLRGEL